MPGPFLLGMGQMLVEGGAVEANLGRAKRTIGEAAARGCRLVVLPECLDCGWTWSGAKALARSIPGEYSDVVCEEAIHGGLYVVAGLTEADGERIFNSAILVSPAGEILWKHRKINELTIAHDLYATGDRLGVVRTPLGVLGVNICADNFPDSLALGQALGQMGCELLLSPCAWAVDADHDNVAEPYGELWRGAYGTLAKLYDMTVVGTSNVGWLRAGPWAGRKCIGNSLVIGPGGTELAVGPHGETAEAIVTVEVNPRPQTYRGTALSERLRERGA